MLRAILKTLAGWLPLRRRLKPMLVPRGEVVFENGRLKLYRSKSMWYLQQGKTVLEFSYVQFEHIAYLLQACLRQGVRAGFGVARIEGQAVVVTNPWQDDKGKLAPHVIVTRQDLREMCQTPAISC